MSNSKRVNRRIGKAVARKRYAKASWLYADHLLREAKRAIAEIERTRSAFSFNV